MKKKNAVLTLGFACIPGAGQMYQGYMKRGLSLVSIFALVIWLATLVDTMLIFACIVFMYSFFDTFNLRAQLMEGTAPPDEYLFHLGEDAQLRRALQSSHKIVGWALVAAGVYALYENFMRSIIQELWENELYWLAEILQKLPTLALCVGLIAVGLWLVRGPRVEPAREDIHYYGAGGPAPADPAAEFTAFGAGPAPEAPAAPRPFAEAPWAAAAEAAAADREEAE